MKKRTPLINHQCRQTLEVIMDQLTVEQAAQYLTELSEVDGGCPHCFSVAFLAIYDQFPTAADWISAAEKAFSMSDYRDRDRLETVKRAISARAELSGKRRSARPHGS
jgi:hypothetical protein